MASRHCFCRQVAKGFMVWCDLCDIWFHDTCVGVKKGAVQDVDEWFCNWCLRTKMTEEKLIERFHEEVETFRKEFQNVSKLESQDDCNRKEQSEIDNLKAKIEDLKTEKRIALEKQQHLEQHVEKLGIENSKLLSELKDNGEELNSCKCQIINLRAKIEELKTEKRMALDKEQHLEQCVEELGIANRKLSSSELQDKGKELEELWKVPCDLNPTSSNRSLKKKSRLSLSKKLNGTQ